jgi:hypothetical protein
VRRCGSTQGSRSVHSAWMVPRAQEEQRAGRLLEGDADFLAGRSEVLSPFVLPPRDAGPENALAPTSDGMLAFDPYPHLWLNAGFILERLMRFAEAAAYDWMNDPEQAQRLRLLERLNRGAPSDEVQGDTEYLWQTLFMAYRLDHFDNGYLERVLLAATRIANEIRRRLLAGRGATRNVGPRSEPKASRAAGSDYHSFARTGPYTPAHPDLIRKSLRGEAERLRRLPSTSETFATARDALIASLHAADESGFQLTASSVPFTVADIRPLTRSESRALANQFALGCGRDDAPIVVVGTEGAFDVPDPASLSSDETAALFAVEGCAQSILWATGGDPAIISHIAGNTAPFTRSNLDALRPIQLYPNDLHRVDKRRGMHTWRVLSQCFGSAGAQLLDPESAIGLGDLVYQIEMNAVPSRRAHGLTSSAERYEFLSAVMTELRETATVLVFHGHPSDPKWSQRDRLANTFLGSRAGSSPDDVLAGSGSAFPIWVAPSGSRTVLWTRALNGRVRREYRDALGKYLIRAAGER